MTEGDLRQLVGSLGLGAREPERGLGARHLQEQRRRLLQGLVREAHGMAWLASSPSRLVLRIQYTLRKLVSEQLDNPSWIMRFWFGALHILELF